MTKAQEIKKLQEFVGALPNGYLKDMLAYVLPQFENDVRSDFPTFVNISEIEKLGADATLKLEDAYRKIRKATIELQDTEKKLSESYNKLGDIRAIARQILS
jgi:hypothetical protein